MTVVITMQDSKPIVYDAPGCPYCFALKQFLEKNGVEFKDVDVSKDQQAAQRVVEKTGQMGVPVLEYNGQFVKGFDAPKVKELLGIA